MAEDLIKLIQASDSIVKYVNKRVAHRDKKKFTKALTFNDLDQAIDSLLDIFNKYRHLLGGAGFVDIKNVKPQWDWKEIFKVAWIQE